MDISIKFTDSEIPKFKGEKNLDAAPWHRIWLEYITTDVSELDDATEKRQWISNRKQRQPIVKCFHLPDLSFQKFIDRLQYLKNRLKSIGIDIGPLIDCTHHSQVQL